MNLRIQDQAAMQQTVVQVLHRAVDGLSEEQLARKGSPVNNDMRWLLAHITTVRYHMAHMLGLGLQNPWGDRFDRGKPEGGAPPAAESVARFDEVSAALQTRYAELGDAELGASCGPFPSTDGTVGGAIHFLTLHDAYHLGQLGFLRKLVGGTNLVG